MRRLQVALLLVGSCLLVNQGVHAVRRSDDELFDHDRDDFGPLPPSPPKRGGDASEMGKTIEGIDGIEGAESHAEPQSDPTKSGGGMVPVIVIIAASKMFPTFAAAGQMPVLASVILAPRVIVYLEEEYLKGQLDEGYNRSIFAAVVSYFLLSMIVNFMTMFGLVKPAEKSVGVKAAGVHHLEYVQGKPIDVTSPNSVKVVEFWATWCPPCEKAIPHLDVMWKKLRQKHGERIQMVGISRGEDADKVKKWMKAKMANQMSYPVAVDPSSSLKAYPSAGIPNAFVVDQNGDICWEGNPLGKGLEEAIEEALAVPANVTAEAPPVLNSEDIPGKLSSTVTKPHVRTPPPRNGGGGSRGP